MDMLIRASERLIKAVMEVHPCMNMDDKKEEELYLAYHNCKEAVKYERERTLSEQESNCNKPAVSVAVACRNCKHYEDLFDCAECDDNYDKFIATER